MHRGAFSRRSSGGEAGAEAVRLAEIACKGTQYSNAGFLDSLAAAYAEADRFDEAVRTCEKALSIALSQKNEKLADVLKAHLASFKKRQPLRE